MAEQDIEQAAKAQLSDKQIADVMEEFPIVASWGRAGINTFASKVQYAMQPHLARESGETQDRGLNLSERAPRIYEERCGVCGYHMTSDAAFSCTPEVCITKLENSLGNAVSSTYGDLVRNYPRIAARLEPHEWDNMNSSQQRDWALWRMADPPAPVPASDVPHSGGLNASLRTHVDGDEILKRLQGAYIASGLCRGILPSDWQVIIDGFLSAVQAQVHLAKLASERYERILELERELADRPAPVASDAPAGEPQSAGDAETVERMLDTFDDVAMGYSAFTGEARYEAMTAALSVAREGYVPASALGPLTDEEWLDLCAGDRVSAETLWRSDIDLFLKRRLAPEPVKAAKTPEERVTIRWNAADEDYEVLLDGRPYMEKSQIELMGLGLIAELKAQKEAANG